MHGNPWLKIGPLVTTVGLILLSCGLLWGCGEKNSSQADQALPGQTAASAAQGAPADSSEASIAVPSVLGLSLEDAADSLREANLQLEANRKVVAGVPEGQVVEQDPKAGALVNKDAIVRLVVGDAAPPFAEGEQRSTPLNDDGRGNMVYLDRHAPDCGANAISQFRLTRAGTNNRYQYLYTCTQGGSLGAPVARSTNLELDGGGNSVYLDRQNVDCGANQVLTKFHLARGRDTVRYDYSCAASNIPLSCRDAATGFNDEGGGNTVYLDRHHVRCNADEAIGQFRLARSGQGTFHYTYRCCGVK